MSDFKTKFSIKKAGVRFCKMLLFFAVIAVTCKMTAGGCFSIHRSVHPIHAPSEAFEEISEIGRDKDTVSELKPFQRRPRVPLESNESYPHYSAPCVVLPSTRKAFARELDELEGILSDEDCIEEEDTSECILKRDLTSSMLIAPSREGKRSGRKRDSISRYIVPLEFVYLLHEHDGCDKKAHSDNFRAFLTFSMVQAGRSRNTELLARWVALSSSCLPSPDANWIKTEAALLRALFGQRIFHAQLEALKKCASEQSYAPFDSGVLSCGCTFKVKIFSLAVVTPLQKEPQECCFFVIHAVRGEH